MAPTPVSELRISNEKIQAYHALDLRTLPGVPASYEDCFALAMRMESAFTDMRGMVLEFIAARFGEVHRKTTNAVLSRATLDFVERYGPLSLLAPSVVALVQGWGVPGVENGARWSKELGLRIAKSAHRAQGLASPERIDFPYALGKARFVGELMSLSSDLGRRYFAETENAEMVQAVIEAMKRYRHLNTNGDLFSRFLSSDAGVIALRKFLTNAQQRVLGETKARNKKEYLTPEQFYFEFVAYACFKSPSTVRREIFSAKSRLLAEVTRLQRRNAKKPSYEKT